MMAESVFHIQPKNKLIFIAVADNALYNRRSILFIKILIWVRANKEILKCYILIRIQRKPRIKLKWQCCVRKISKC